MTDVFEGFPDDGNTCHPDCGPIVVTNTDGQHAHENRDGRCWHDNDDIPTPEGS